MDAIRGTQCGGGQQREVAKVFDKMASLSGFSKEDCAELFAHASSWAPSKVAAVLGYLLGRFDSHDAAALVAALREIQPLRDFSGIDGRPTVNIVGTGGGPSTFNITTTATFVVAAAGVIVVKTGSNACRSKSGYGDLAAKLGTLKVAMPWERIEEIVNETGIVFLPPSCHAAVLGILAVRSCRDLGSLSLEAQAGSELPAPRHVSLPTTYRNSALYLNKLGPLLSPVKVDYRFIGAHSATCLETLAGACRLLGDVPTTLVSSMDGLDEVSTMAQSNVIHLAADGGRRDDLIDPQELDIQPPPLVALRGYEPAAAAKCTEQILSGAGTTAQNDIVALNAGAVLAAVGVCSDLSAGFDTALQILKDGEGHRKLCELRERVWQCVKH